MSKSLFMISPGAFTAYQVCTCKGSRTVDNMNLEQGPVQEDGKVKVSITSRPMVCSVCKTPYRVMVNPKRVSVITNIGE